MVKLVRETRARVPFWLITVALSLSVGHWLADRLSAWAFAPPAPAVEMPTCGADERLVHFNGSWVCMLKESQ